MSGPQLDIDSLRRFVDLGGLLTHEQQREVMHALAAAEQMPAAWRERADRAAAGLQHVRCGVLRAVAKELAAALGAAVTPTPQEGECICDGGAYIDKMKPDWRPFVVNPQCVLHGIAPVTSTPEAATGATEVDRCDVCDAVALYVHSSGAGRFYFCETHKTHGSRPIRCEHNSLTPHEGRSWNFHSNKWESVRCPGCPGPTPSGLQRATEQQQ